MKQIKELLSFIIIIASIILIRLFIVTPVRVEGNSMYKTLSEGNILILNKLDHTYERFEIVVFNYKNERLIKRVIGLPGETVEFKDNKLYINDQEIEDNYGYGKTANYTKEIVPEDSYFLVGDNRNNSLDSRYFGMISKKDIAGTVSFVIFPFDKFGKIG